jgi:hypothetical protein
MLARFSLLDDDDDVTTLFGATDGSSRRTLLTVPPSAPYQPMETFFGAAYVNSIVGSNSNF